MTSSDDDESSLGPARRYSHEDFLDAVAEMDGMATTPEISDIVGCSNDTTRRRMKELLEDEEYSVRHRDVGQYSLWIQDT